MLLLPYFRCDFVLLQPVKAAIYNILGHDLIIAVPSVIACHRLLFPLIEQYHSEVLMRMNEKKSTDESSNTDHDAESLLLADYNHKQKHPSRLKSYLPWIAHALSIVSCLGILSHAISIHNKSRRSCIKRFNAYCMLPLLLPNDQAKTLPAPLLDTIDHDWQDVRFEYSLWYKSPFKGPPNPKVHEAWHDIMKCKPSSPIILPNPFQS